ncbi:MAG: GtrA family protein [Actinomycetota bacterium]
MSDSTPQNLINTVREVQGVAARYGAVSILNVINHQILLNIAHNVWGWGGGVSNVFAAFLAAIPAYFISRQWVWKVQGAHSIRGEVVPFWTLSLLGLLISTALAEGGERIFGSGLPVALGSLLGYFIVWLAKFVILDKMFEASARRIEGESFDPTPSSAPPR